MIFLLEIKNIDCLFCTSFMNIFHRFSNLSSVSYLNCLHATIACSATWDVSVFTVLVRFFPVIWEHQNLFPPWMNASREEEKTISTEKLYTQFALETISWICNSLYDVQRPFLWLIWMLCGDFELLLLFKMNGIWFWIHSRHLHVLDDTALNQHYTQRSLWLPTAAMKSY